MSPLLEVSGLCKFYGSVRAAHQIGFHLQKGEAVALLGPNGSGKTTVLRLLAGLLKPDAGWIRLSGLDPRKDWREYRRHFSYLPQQPRFAAALTVRETVAFHAGLRSLGKESVGASLKQAGFSEAEAERPVGELSGGMKQRLSLALAALPEADLAILDEPTASLDPEAALELRKLVRRWRGQGKAILFATHVLADVEQLANRVIVLVEGRQVADETIAALRARLRRYAVLRVNVGMPSQDHVRLARQLGAVQVKINSHALIVSAPIELRYDILKGLNSLGPIHHFETEEPSIEQVYLDYVHEGGVHEG